ncbi:MAG: cytochrome P450 [Isosphaeraceae bacterium]|nr:cytochrome P450 [Isosphaeraceae bacterium]
MSTLAAPRRRPPSPPSAGLLGHARPFVSDHLGFLTKLFREYGDVVAMRLVHRPIVVVNHPDLVEEVLVTKNKSFIKHFALRQAKMNLGKGLLTSEGDFWRAQRKLVQPAFHRERIDGYARSMVALTDRALAGWADGETRDVQADMMRLTLEIVAKTLFDADVADDSAEVNHAMEVLLDNFSSDVGRLFKPPNWFPTPRRRRGRAASRRLDSIIYRIIAERRASPHEDRGDLLSMLLRAQDEESGAGMSDAQLRDEAMTLFLAGHETTANTLAWAFWLLARHPEVEARLHDEVDRVLGDRLASLADLTALPYTNAVVTETLRLYPTVWLLGREAIEPIEIGGYPIKPGTTIYMSEWVIHRDPRNFDDPESYRPERWLDGLEKRIHRYAYFPFGGGPRICIGNQFALMESALLLATIARRFRLLLSPNADVVPQPTMTLRPKHGVEVVLQARA